MSPAAASASSLEAFNDQVGVNQLHVTRDDVRVSATDVLKVPEGTITEQGLRWNIDVGLQYLAAWLGGLGCVPIYNLMEDTATAEICRAQLWQWVKHGARIECGRLITSALVDCLIQEQIARLRDTKFVEAGDIFSHLTRSHTFPEFLTLLAYDHIN
jgi:malate synthase